MNDIFRKPHVWLMLMVTCLSPFMSDLLAHCPHSCDTASTRVENARDAMCAAYAARALARVNMNDKHDYFMDKQRAAAKAIMALLIAGWAATYGGWIPPGMGEGLGAIGGFSLLKAYYKANNEANAASAAYYAARDAYNAAKKAFDDACDELKAANEALKACQGDDSGHPCCPE